MRLRQRHVLGVMAWAAMACGGGSGTTSPMTPASMQLSVAGSYPTAVAIVTDACGGSVVQPNPTTVTHTAGSASLQLAHAGSNYTGSIQTNGNFSTTPSSVTITAATYTVAMTGKFTTSGFTSTVTVDRVDAAHPSPGCRYTVSWTATRSTGQNVIPG